MIRDTIKTILSGASLSQTEARAVMDQIMNGEATPVQIAGFLIALKQKGESAAEVAGFVQSMREQSIKIAVDNPNAVDGCGTGGDGAHTFNISTAASLVAAAAGVTVAKHGNRSVSSKCGSADLLTAIGAEIDPGPEKVAEHINKTGFGFMFAPRFHPAMKHAATPRRELGVRTIFNILGPMTNPAGVKRQVIGVYDRALMPLMAEVLQMTGSEHVLLVHSDDGLDELSVTAPTSIYEMKAADLFQRSVRPEDVGLPTHPSGSLAGGEAAENHDILKKVLAGEKSAYRDAILFNSGAMVYVSGSVKSIEEGVKLAAEAIDKGKATAKLNDWVAATRT